MVILNFGKMNTRTKSLSNLSEFSLDEFKKIICEEVISATDSQFKQLLDDEKLRKIIRKETTLFRPKSLNACKI